MKRSKRATFSTLIGIGMALVSSAAGASDWEDFYWQVYGQDGKLRGDLLYEEHAGNYAVFRTAPRGSRFFVLGLDDIYTIPDGSSGYYMMYKQTGNRAPCTGQPPRDQHGETTNLWGTLEIVWSKTEAMNFDLYLSTCNGPLKYYGTARLTGN